MSDIQPSNNYKVYQWMIDDLKLKGSEKDIYALFYSFYANGQSISMSCNYIANRIGVTRQNVIVTLEKLKSKNIILVEGSQGKKLTFALLKTCNKSLQVDTSTCNKSLQVEEETQNATCNKSLQEHVTKVYKTCNKSLHNKESNNQNNKESTLGGIGINKNIIITREQYEQFKNDHPNTYQDQIDNLSNKLLKYTYKGKSHYLILCEWFKQDRDKWQSMEQERGTRKMEKKLHEQQRKNYDDEGDCFRLIK